MSPLDYTVVIPTRKRIHLLEQAVESVLAQTAPPSEIIIVVDGDSQEDYEAFRKHYPECRLLFNSTPRGPSGSRNRGIEQARSTWICLLDDDDIWHSGKQQAFQTYLEMHPDCRALRSEIWHFTESPQSTSALSGFMPELLASDRATLEAAAEHAAPINDLSYLDIQGRSLELLLERNRGVTSTTMFRKSLMGDQSPVPDDLRTAEDWLLFVYIASQTEWHLVPGRWGFYRLHSAQSTKNLADELIEDRFTAWTLAWHNSGLPAGIDPAPYGREYAKDVRHWFWRRLTRGHPFKAWTAYREARAVITRRADRISILIPPPIAFRFGSLARWPRNRK